MTELQADWAGFGQISHLFLDRSPGYYNVLAGTDVAKDWRERKNGLKAYSAAIIPPLLLNLLW